MKLLSLSVRRPCSTRVTFSWGFNPGFAHATISQNSHDRTVYHASLVCNPGCPVACKDLQTRMWTAYPTLLHETPDRTSWPWQPPQLQAHTQAARLALHGSLLTVATLYEPSITSKPQQGPWQLLHLQAYAQAARLALHALVLGRHNAPARVKLHGLLAQLVAVPLALHCVPQQVAVVALQLADLPRRNPVLSDWATPSQRVHRVYSTNASDSQPFLLQSTSSACFRLTPDSRPAATLAHTCYLAET